MPVQGCTLPLPFIDQLFKLFFFSFSLAQRSFRLLMPVPSTLTHKSGPAVSLCYDLCFFSQWTANTVTTKVIYLFFFPQVCFSASQHLWISFHFNLLNQSLANRPTICIEPMPYIFKDNMHCMSPPQVWLLHKPNDNFLYSEQAILQNTVSHDKITQDSPWLNSVS